MADIKNYTQRDLGLIRTMTPEEALAFWSPEAVEERERSAPESRE